MLRFYLAGPVGYDELGTKWKDDIKEELRSFGHEVYDPIENDDKYPLVPTMNNLKHKPRANYKYIKSIMKPIFMDDCEYIGKTDYIICFFRNRALGTASEQGIAYYMNRFLGKKIKTITIFDEGFRPDEWTICCSDYVFFSIEECLKFLRKEFISEAVCHPRRKNLQCQM